MGGRCSCLPPSGSSWEGPGGFLLVEVQSPLGSGHRIVETLVPFLCDACGPGLRDVVGWLEFLPDTSGSQRQLDRRLPCHCQLGRDGPPVTLMGRRKHAQKLPVTHSLRPRWPELVTCVLESVTSKDEIAFQTFLTMTHDTPLKYHGLLPTVAGTPTHACM